MPRCILSSGGLKWYDIGEATDVRNRKRSDRSQVDLPCTVDERRNPIYPRGSIGSSAEHSKKPAGIWVKLEQVQVANRVLSRWR